ncbi:site-specific integrase [Pseudarthrobacter sp. PS3-L1]|uniref:tyrosine-type recombinase/integrase n=1 Tax=Pseudarthrobacter sp. PS3-L1 TaxID=3046207 RepID=UPI0024BAF358|nr:site-specific integrase [Pseudarthrobacter sp. PS3-L1]MDJ0319795.1 site-specific integrase [Pseudarthrobacter sp. PS3-L1]
MARVEDRWVNQDKSRSALYGKGLRYRAEWTPLGERKQRKSFATKAAATNYLADQVAEMNKGTYVTKSKKVLFADYAASWEKSQLHLRESSREQISRKLRNHLIPAFENKTLDAITRAHVQEAVSEWSKTLAPATLKVTYGYLASMYKAAVMDGVVGKSPCVGIKLTPIEDVAVVPLRTEKVQELADASVGVYRRMVIFCAATGLRSSELRGLTWDRVDFTTSMVTVDRQLIGSASSSAWWGPLKTRSSRRSIHVGEATLQLLKELQAGQPGYGGLVFHDSGNAITRKMASSAWQVAKKKVEGLGAGWHELRHYAASLWISGGMSPVAVAHRLGHKDATETLRVYSHLWPSDDRRAAELSDGMITLPRATSDDEADV